MGLQCNPGGGDMDWMDTGSSVDPRGREIFWSIDQGAETGFECRQGDREMLWSVLLVAEMEHQQCRPGGGARV